MNPNTDKDPLDQRIDALLSSRPLRPSDDFTARVLAAAEKDAASRTRIRRIIPFALPLAAAIAIAFTWVQVQNSAVITESPTAITAADAEEIFLLEEGLAGLAGLADNEFGSGELLSTLDALYLEI